MFSAFVPLLTCNQVIHKSGRHAENPHQYITDGQIKDENVGDCSHLPILHHNEAHQHVADHAHEEDEGVGKDKHGGHKRGMLVVG